MAVEAAKEESICGRSSSHRRRLVVFFVLFLAVRGLPVLLFYRHDLPMRGRVQMMLLTATALPLLVALAENGALGRRALRYGSLVLG